MIDDVLGNLLGNLLGENCVMAYGAMIVFFLVGMALDSFSVSCKLFKSTPACNQEEAEKIKLSASSFLAAAALIPIACVLLSMWKSSGEKSKKFF